ncbi:hypothetical protein F751_3935 [Auxenochlorella protothecoides]|uniref:DUF155 domain-containing protein n=1 Tax=Auxenochlorella protothecoides TaxID=3075 RepID=A0A087SHQ1_AUXPR|nr:hypothetical protein F751_3935 [Auxenochlorella protothecoides]KFM25255.1 hypothetical protein F751_3935 [Auxenochlorella protothecoides]
MHRGALLLGPHQSLDPDTAEEQGIQHGPYIVAFPYGSVVLIGNSQLPERDRWLSACRSVAGDPTPAAERPYNEGAGLAWWEWEAGCTGGAVVCSLGGSKPPCALPGSDPPIGGGGGVDAGMGPHLIVPDHLMAQPFQAHCTAEYTLSVISQVLAQSVALDYYSSHVERMLGQFTQINKEMKETLNLKKINAQELLRLVAENNVIMTDIITKLGVNERYDIAWKYVQYGRIWDYLRSELEMDARFKTLDMKLNLVQDNLKYFLEIFQDRKARHHGCMPRPQPPDRPPAAPVLQSTSLEWIIIILIGVEICLSLLDLYHKGMMV